MNRINPSYHRYEGLIYHIYLSNISSLY